jgi:pSer/pThr/pTyr-binding forkhead associated (FHA) protein
VIGVTRAEVREAMMESGAGHAAARGGAKQGKLVPPGAVILVQSGFYEGLEVCVDRDWLVVGRGRSADLVLAEPTISRSHAAIGFDAQGFFVQDLGSTNGTLVNGSRAERTPLKDGDVIQMGKLKLGVTLPG